MKFPTPLISLILLLTLSLQSYAHFKLTYPTWRGDSLSNTNASISQWTYPCGNLSPTSQRTPWPLTGGSISLDLHHHWTYLFVNLGFGTYVTNFNVSLKSGGGRLVNETGNGTFCWGAVSLPSPEVLGINVVDGMEASIQLVTVGDSGSALYNCADIIFTSNATLLPPDQCVNSTDVTASVIQSSAQTSDTTGKSGSGSSSPSATGAATSSPYANQLRVLGVAAAVGMVMEVV